MKKIVLAVLALAITPVAFAGQIEKNTPKTVTTADSDCPLLSEGIKISLSKDVEGGYSCNTTSNMIAVSTCNANGKKTGTNNNFYTASGAGGSVAVATDAACTAAAAEGKAATAAGPAS